MLSKTEPSPNGDTLSVQKVCLDGVDCMFHPELKVLFPAPTRRVALNSPKQQQVRMMLHLYKRAVQK